MKKIKLKETVKDIKVLDKSNKISTHMKNAFTRSKGQAEHTQSPEYDSSAEYASDRITHGAEDTAIETMYQVKRQSGKAVDKYKEIRRKHKEKKKIKTAENTPDRVVDTADTATDIAKNAINVPDTAIKTKETGIKVKDTADEAKKAANLPKENSITHKVKKQAQDTSCCTSRISQITERTVGTIGNTHRTEKAVNQSVRASKKTVKSAAKGTAKTVQKTIKTAEKSTKVTTKKSHQTAKATVKTAQATEKAARAAAKASARAAKVSAQVTRTTTKTTVVTTKAAVKATITAVKSLVALIAAGGGVAVVIILVICMVALFAGSVFGIFFTGENTGDPTGRTIVQVMSEMNTEYYDRIEQIQNDNPYDIVEINSSDGVVGIKWNEVLAVYAVKVTADPDNATEVVTIDDSKVDILRSIIWHMNSVTHSTVTVEKERTVTTTDEDGNEVMTTETFNETVLTITVIHKSYLDMANKYNFNSDQRAQLDELMSDEYIDLWAELLGGYSAGNCEIIISGAD